MVLASNLLLPDAGPADELTRRVFDLLRDYELEDPDQVPDGAERMATMWSMIPDDRGSRCEAAAGRLNTAAAAPPGRPVGRRPVGLATAGRRARAAFSGRMRRILQNMVN